MLELSADVFKVGGHAHSSLEFECHFHSEINEAHWIYRHPENGNETNASDPPSCSALCLDKPFTRDDISGNHTAERVLYPVHESHNPYLAFTLPSIGAAIWSPTRALIPWHFSTLMEFEAEKNFIWLVSKKIEWKVGGRMTIRFQSVKLDSPMLVSIAEAYRV